MIAERGKMSIFADGEVMKTILHREALAEIRVNTYTLPRFKVGDIDIYIPSALWVLNLKISESSTIS